MSIISKCEIVGGSGIGSPVSQSVPILLGYHHILPNECSVILYIHAPVHIYGVTYFSTTTTSDVVVAITLQDPGT